jgi:hypothetical protein
MVIRGRGIVLIVFLGISSASFHLTAGKGFVTVLAGPGKFLSAFFSAMVRAAAIQAELLTETSFPFFRGDFSFGGFQIGVVNCSGGAFLRGYCAGISSAWFGPSRPILFVQVVCVVEGSI